MITSITQVRPELLAIAMLMEQRLRDKDEDKGVTGWKKCATFTLATTALAKASAMHVSSTWLAKETEVIKHAVDVANYCMMLVDVLDGLPDVTDTAPQSAHSPAIAAIEYAISKNSEGIEFLRCWLYGEFPEIHEGWPDAPEAVFIGADPLHPETKLEGGAA